MRRFLLLLSVLFVVTTACGGGDAADSADGSAASSVAVVETEDATTPDNGVAEDEEPAEPAENGDSGQSDSEGTAQDGADSSEPADEPDDTPAASGKLGDVVLSDVDATQIPGRFEAVFRVVPGPGVSDVGPIEMTITGAFDPETNSSQIFMDLGSLLTAAPAEELAELPPAFAEVFEEPMELITIGDTGYMKWGFFNAFLGADGWIELPATEAGTMTSDFGFGGTTGSPAELLDQLREADADIAEVGRETVRGVDTTHYLAVLDLEKLAEQAPPEERDEIKSQFGDSGLDEVPIELWIGDDGLVYRYVMELDPDAAPDMEDVESVSMTFEMFDYGVAVEIVPPDPSEVTSIDELGGGFGFDFEG